MGAIILFKNYYAFFIGVISVLVIVCVPNSGAFPTESGPWEETGGEPVLIKGEENLNLTSVTRQEREIDLRQNLHKHLKPLVGVSASSLNNLKKPKPVEKAITPYFVRILKRRPGSSNSKESSEDELDSTEIPKVLIDRRRNKENPILPVVVIDENGIPLRNRTVLLERDEPSSSQPGPNELIITEIESKTPINPVAEALQSLQLQDALSAASTPTPITSPEPTPTTEPSPLVLTEPTHPSPEPIPRTSEATPPPPSSSISIIELTSSTPPPDHIPTSDSPSESFPSFQPHSSNTFPTGPISIPPSLVAPEVHETIEPQLIQPNPDSIYQITSEENNNADLTSTSTAYPTDSQSSFSTLAVTRVLPNNENTQTTTVSQQEEAMQASEILPQKFPATTTPITTSILLNNNADVTTVKPTETELQSPSSSSAISGEQLQQLMKAALTRLLLQGSTTTIPQQSGNKLPEVSIPQQVRLVENKPKNEELVVFSPAPSPAQSDLISRPTSPMPSILNALQSLISISPPTTPRPNNFFFPTQPSPKAVESPLGNIFSFNPQDNPFTRLFSTTRASTTNYAIVRSTRTTTAPPTYFINLRESKTTELPRTTGDFNQAATTRIPILATPGKTWEEFNGRQNSQNPSPLRTILMMPANFMMGMFKAAQQFGEFLGNTFSNFATAFNPNRNRL